MLRRVTGKEPDRTASPDEAVAHGAALYAATLLNQRPQTHLARCQLQNINSHSLGVVGIDPLTRQRTTVTLIPKNTPIPCRVSRVFPTAKADQRSVKVAVVEGESQRPEECILLGECVVRDLPPGLPKGAQVHVEYSYAANGRIAVSAHVPQARQSARVEIVHNQERDLEDLETWRDRLRGGDAQPGSVFASGGPVDLNDRTSVLRRLDALYVEVGKAAVGEPLPAALARSQQRTQAAAAELARSRTALAQAEQAKQAAARLRLLGPGAGLRRGQPHAQPDGADDRRDSTAQAASCGRLTSG
jgi:molecular chaperone DnaK (HSP70)